MASHPPVPALHSPTAHSIMHTPTALHCTAPRPLHTPPRHAPSYATLHPISTACFQWCYVALPPPLDTASQRTADCTSVEPHRDLVTCIAPLCTALLRTASRSNELRRPRGPTQPARPNPTWPYLRGPQTLGAPRGRLQPIRTSREAAPTSRRREGSERSLMGAELESAPPSPAGRERVPYVRREAVTRDVAAACV